MSGGDPTRLGTASPFNIKLKSVRLGDFTPREVAELYGQHTAETGQSFASGAVEHAYELTAGQPWLVNALALEIVEEIGVPVAEAITVDHLEAAKEPLILARATHLDSLAARLSESRVRKYVGPLLAGDPLTLEPYDDDLSYVRDLGLIAPTPPVRVANPIYREVIARVLSGSIQESVTADPRSFVRADGGFDFRRMLVEFADWWRENGDFLVSSGFYHEAAPELILMGYLQRVVNGGGLVEREYAIGSGRIDLLVRYRRAYRDHRRHQPRRPRDHRPARLSSTRRGTRQLSRASRRAVSSTSVMPAWRAQASVPPQVASTRSRNPYMAASWTVMSRSADFL
jgi:hypothetical protein